MYSARIYDGMSSEMPVAYEYDSYGEFGDSAERQAQLIAADVEGLRGRKVRIDFLDENFDMLCSGQYRIEYPVIPSE